MLFEFEFGDFGMIEDSRLFSSNSPIGRVFYFINMVLLVFLALGVHIGITSYMLPVITPSFVLPVKIALYFSYIIFIITFFMLIDRRLFDICGSRDTKGYLFISKIINFVILLFVLSVIAFITGSQLAPLVYKIFEIFLGIFALLILILGFIPGKSK